MEYIIFSFYNYCVIVNQSELGLNMCKSIHISSSKFYVYFTRKNLLFLFYTITFIKHPHQFIYFIRYFDKIFILLNFFIISHNYHFNTCARSLSFITHFSWIDHLSLSLSLSLSKTTESLSFFFIVHQVLSSPGPFFTGRSRSFLHLSIHEPSSDDPDPFFTGRSTNQSSWPRSLLHRPIHKPNSTSTDLSISLLVCLCGFVCVWVCFCVDLSVWMCLCLCASEEKEDEETEVVVHREEREKLVRTEINKIIYTHATVSV